MYNFYIRDRQIYTERNRKRDRETARQIRRIYTQIPTVAELKEM